jgi:hypothetical protein
MSKGAWMMALVVLMVFGSLGFLMFSMLRSIRDERTRGRSIWREFGLGLSLMILFFVTWVGHGIAQWQEYTDSQIEHGEPIAIGDFMSGFGASTLENWQSEFLQLFSFVVLAALYIHKGSAESKDGEDVIQASLRRIEEKLDTLPSDAPKAKGERWKLPDTPQKMIEAAKS